MQQGSFNDEEEKIDYFTEFISLLFVTTVLAFLFIKIMFY